MRCLTLRNLVGLAGGMTAAGGALVLRLMQPADLSWVPTLSVVAASVLLAAAAPAVDFIRTRRAHHRFRASLRAEGAAMVEEGYFQTGPASPVLSDAYSTREGGQ